MLTSSGPPEEEDLKCAQIICVCRQIEPVITERVTARNNLMTTKHGIMRLHFRTL